MAVYVGGEEVGTVIVEKNTKLQETLNKTITNLTAQDLEGVTQIPRYAFQNCYDLTSVEFPSILQTIGEYAFYNCYSLTSITIPDSVTRIGNLAFSSCSGLTSITIPEGVTSISGGAFFTCSALLSVTYLGQAPNILSTTFGNCDAVIKYDFRNCTTVPTLASTASLGHASGCQIIIPDALYDEWTTATNWVSLTNVVWVKASEVSDD